MGFLSTLLVLTWPGPPPLWSHILPHLPHSTPAHSNIPNISASGHLHLLFSLLGMLSTPFTPQVNADPRAHYQSLLPHHHALTRDAVILTIYYHLTT